MDQTITAKRVVSAYRAYAVSGDPEARAEWKRLMAEYRAAEDKALAEAVETGDNSRLLALRG